MAMLEDLVVQFANRGAHSLTGDKQGAFESTVLVGQASCLSFLDRQARCLSHHFCPKYVTDFMKKSTWVMRPPRFMLRHRAASFREHRTLIKEDASKWATLRLSMSL